MATLAALKKQIAALEAQVQRATNEEMNSAISRVRKMMADFGLTIEHLSSGTSKSTGRSAGAKKAPGKKVAAKSKGAKPARYADPRSGATWSGLGRIPHWIAGAKDRNEFLIDKASTPGDAKPAAKAASKTVTAPVAKKTAPAGKTASKKVAAKKTTGVKAAAKPASKPAVKPATKAPAKKAAQPAAKAAAGKPAARKSSTRKSVSPESIVAIPATTGSSASI